MKTVEKRYYQLEADRNITTELCEGGRGKLLTACGTGKTYMSLKAAEKLCAPGGVVFVTCPSIGLVAQTLNEWREFNSDHAELSVCSDDDSIEDDSHTVEDLPGLVTTDIGEIEAWLRAPTTKKIRLIVATHVSAHLVGQALRNAGQRAELFIIDEAHHTAGRVNKHLAKVHHDEHIPARRRLYATATEKLYNVSSARGANGERVQVVGMDNEAIYGRVLYRYPISRAIADGYLDDYRVAVIGVTKAQVLAVLRELRRDVVADERSPALHMATVQTALAKAARQFDLRRVLVFCPLVREAAEFARTMQRTLDALAHDAKPSLRLHAAHVHGGMNMNQRREQLQRLATPSDDEWSVVANARVLGEGVDVPKLDCVAFEHAKKSITDIVQAVGRAIRRGGAKSGIATILVPILLPDNPDDVVDDEVMPDADYEILWRVVTALRAHDEAFGAELDDCRARGAYEYDPHGPLRRIQVMLPEGYDNSALFQHVTMRIVKLSTSNWWDGYGALKRFKETFGHANPAPKYVDPVSGRKLGSWVRDARADFSRGALAADRYEALQRLGFVFDPLGARWEGMYQLAADFHQERGHLRVPRDHPLSADGMSLYGWLRRQSSNHRRGILEAERFARLDALGMIWHSGEESWAKYLAVATAYRETHGHLRPPSGTVIDDVDLYEWLSNCRSKRKQGKLSDARIAQLDALGMEWKVGQTPTSWASGVRAAREFHAEYGHLDVPDDFRSSMDIDLARWLRNRGADFRRGDLAPKRAAELSALDPHWAARLGSRKKTAHGRTDRANWQARFGSAKRYYEQHGDLRVRRGCVFEGRRLDVWVTSQRVARRDGRLSDDQISMLDEIGMDWELKETPTQGWFRYLASARDFYEKHGHLNVADVLGRPDPLNRLYIWVRKQCAAKAAGELSDERVGLLEAVGIDWNTPTVSDLEWQDMFEVARQYALDNGHLQPPVSEQKLYHWLGNQRYFYKAGTLPDARTELLSSIGMAWEFEPKVDRIWKGYIELARAFHDKHGHLNVVDGDARLDYDDPLYVWVRRQAKLKSQGKLSAERQAELEAFCIKWEMPSLNEVRWEENFAEAKLFYLRNGHLRPPLTQQKLYKWVNFQRRKRPVGKLTEDQVQRLNAIGMDW